jgi:hypothetical protein
MAHYRKIDVRIWLDKKFNTLSTDSQFVFLYLLTHPQLTALGAMRSTLQGLSAELDWPLERFEGAFEALRREEMVAIDKNVNFVWLMNFLKYNPPESPNVVKSWEMYLGYLPECELKNTLIQNIHTFLTQLPEAFQSALPACFQVVSFSDAKNNCSEEAPEFETSLPTTLSEGLPEGGLDFSESLPEGLREGFREPFAKTSPNHKALNIKHKTISIKQEQKERRILQENNLVKKEKIEAIKNIVAPTRQKNIKHSDCEVAEVFCYWQQTLNHPQAVLDDKRRKRIRQALAMGYSVQQLCEAILGCSYTPHNMGHNEQGQRYDGLQVIFRDADQIDRFIRNAHSPPRLQNAADKLENSNLAIGQQWYREKIAQGNTYEQT